MTPTNLFPLECDANPGLWAAPSSPPRVLTAAAGNGAHPAPALATPVAVATAVITTTTAAAASVATQPGEAPPGAADPTRPAPSGGRRVTVAPLPVGTALTRQDGPQRAWFDWSANPYRGCEFGCGYCYARGTHRWLGHPEARDFQERIYVKQGFAEALRRDLRLRVRPGEHVAFGTATDPYQPIEQRECVMRAVLRELERTSGLRISITTKSPLVARDAELLRRVAVRNAVSVNVSLVTADARLARVLEPRAPAPSARIEALRALRQSGVRAGVFLMPVLPGISDGDSDLRALLHAVADAGAEFVAHQVVFLEGAARTHFLATLRRAYPRVAARYEVWTRTGRSLPLEIRRDVAERVRALVRAAGVAGPVGESPPAPAFERQREFEFVA